MDAKFAKVLDNGRRVVVDSRRRRAARFASYLSGVSCSAFPHISTLDSSSIMLGKRKKPDVCKTKCRCCKLASQKTSILYYTNFMKSALPKRLLVYQLGKWVDHDAEVVGIVRKEFEQRKATVEVNINNYHLIIDFVRMVQFNFRTYSEQPIAWIDEEGCCFFPEVHIDGDDQYGKWHPEIQKDELSFLSGSHAAQEIELQIEIEVNNVGEAKLVEYCGESSPCVKRIKVGQNTEVEDSCNKVSDVRMEEDVGENQHLETNLDPEAGKSCIGLNHDTVKEMFLNSMNLAGSANVVEISSSLGSMWQGRLELFLKQAEITKNLRGNPNVRYAWFASTKDTLSSIMTYGLGHFGFQQIKSAYGIGVHLTAANCAHTSANNCDVDENGVRYMVLCRVVMGNMEVVHPGSRQSHPSSWNFDSGVDDITNPRHYVVWSMNINTHIYPEYVVSFKIPANFGGCALKNDGKVVNSSNVGAALDNGSDHQSNLTCDGHKESISLDSILLRTPKSPWMPFPLLLSAISKQIPPNNMNLVKASYHLFKSKMISRKEFTDTLRRIVGHTLLKSTILELIGKTLTTADDFTAKQETES